MQVQTCFLSMAASRELQAPLLPLLPSSSLSPKEESNCFMGFSLQSEVQGEELVVGWGGWGWGIALFVMLVLLQW